MKTNLKKALSIFLALAFVLSAITVTGITAMAENEETEVTLADGSKWLTQLGSNVTLTQNAPGDYSVTPVDASTNDNTDFLVLSKQGFAPGIDRYGFAVDYRDNAPTFGFKDEYSLNSGNSITFSRIESGNSTSLIVTVGGTDYTVWNGTATRATRCIIEIVKDGGSYYLNFRGKDIKGEGCSAAVQDYLKLENHFSKAVLENGMLHFYMKALKFNTGNPVKIVKTRNFVGDNTLVSAYDWSGDSNTPSAWTFSGEAPNVNYNTADREYTFSLKKSASVTLGLPCAKLDGNADNASFSMYVTRDENPTTRDWGSVAFSNDPYFADGTVESITTVEEEKASLVMFLPNSGPEVARNYNMYNGAKTTFTFSGNDTYVTNVGIVVGGQGVINIGFSKNVIKANKPIYVRIHKEPTNSTRDYSITVPAFNDAAVATKAALLADDLTDVYASKELADNFVASELAFDSEARCKYTEVYNAYDRKVAADAKIIDDAINALIPVDEVLWQDKGAVEAALALYNNAPDAVKGAVTSTDLIAQYAAKLETLDDNGIIRAGDGKLYKAIYNPDYISVANRDDDNAIVASVLDGTNTANSALTLATATKYPVLSGKYEMRLYFGTLDNSSNFGIAADQADLTNNNGGLKNNTFVLYRTESGNNHTFYVTIDGTATPCLVKNGTVRNRNWTIGVTKLNGDYYMTVDGTAVTGEGYSDEVKEAVKLNNHFDKDFLEGNNGVYFYASANSMLGGASLRATVNVENNLIIDTQNRFSDRNGNAAEYNAYTKSTLTATEDGNVYNFAVPSAGSVTIAEPINPNGFNIKAKMSAVSGNQYVKFDFSNDPLFLDSNNIVGFNIIQFTNSTQVVYSGGELTARFSGFFGNSVVRQMSFVESNGAYRLRLYTSGNDLTASTLDFAGLIGKPIYLRISGGASVEPEITITNKVDDKPYMTNSAALDAATEAYLAGEAAAVATGIDAQIGEICSVPTDFCYYKDEAGTIAAAISGLSARQTAALELGSEFEEIRLYLASLPDEVNATSLTGCCKTILGTLDDGICYDYYRDGSLNLKDLIRMKKIGAEQLKK